MSGWCYCLKSNKNNLEFRVYLKVAVKLTAAFYMYENIIQVKINVKKTNKHIIFLNHLCKHLRKIKNGTG